MKLNNYRIVERYDVDKIELAINITAIVVLFLAFFLMGPLFHNGFNPNQWVLEIFSPQIGIGLIIIRTVIAIVIFLGIIIVHELIHGAFLFAFGRNRPLFGRKRGCLYAAIPPMTYLSKTEFMISTLSPLVMITITTLVICRLVSLASVGLIYYCAVTNIAASVSDMHQSLWIHKQKKNNKFGFDGKGTIVVQF